MKWNNTFSDFTFCPYIKTEETIFNQIKNENFSDDYEIMPYPLAHWINTIGLQETNHIIKNLLKSDRKRVFVCQHILVDQIYFDDEDIVFTPHSTLSDNFISIPHYSVNFDIAKIKEYKKYKFSFIGSTKTHWTRKLLTQLYPQFCIDSGAQWGLDKNLPLSFKDKYINLLGDSIFSICPRGTGISSVRLFESICMNSIPIIIADNYKKPLNDFINWDEFSITIEEKNISELNYIIDKYDNDTINIMRKNLINVYNNFFNNENLSITIKKKLKQK